MVSSEGGSEEEEELSMCPALRRLASTEGFPHGYPPSVAVSSTDYPPEDVSIDTGWATAEEGGESRAEEGGDDGGRSLLV